jgi:hypothetical protein
MCSSVSTAVQSKRAALARLPSVTTEGSKEIPPMQELYPDHARAIWMLYDLRDPEACEHLHEQRATWQELSDLAALGPDHMILIIWPGAALREAA